jgi:hypothetical protein
MPFFARPVSDEAWIQFARPIFAEALVSANFLSQAVQERDVEAQVSASRAILEGYPTLEQAIRKGASPTSLDARNARDSLQLSLRDYMDGARQGLVLNKDWPGKGEVAKKYYEIVEKAESLFQAAGTFLTRSVTGNDHQR